MFLIVYPKMKIVNISCSSFPNFNEFISSVEHKEDILKSLGNFNSC